MPTVINLRQQRTRHERGVGGAPDPTRMAYAAGVMASHTVKGPNNTISRWIEGVGSNLAYERDALQAGVIALSETVKKPKLQEQEEPTFTDEQLQELASPALAETVELIDA
jgi:hypothetical protein